MKRLTLLFGALLAAALCTLPTADAAAQPKPTKYNLCRKHPADGPYIVYDAKKGAYAATADKRGRVRVMLYGGGPVEVRSSRGAYLFSVMPHAVERGPRELPQAPKLFVTSDLHGDFRSFATLLQAHGVIDDDCRWSYGNNQLAVIGDIFDRGYDVLPLLWLMYKLEQEAADAGGAAVLLLGNHEGMVLAGDVRYTRGKYLETARQLGMENYRQLFSPDTELGRWLATRNTMLRIGRNLFVHAGLSARLLERDLEMDTLNARMSEGLYRTSKERREDPTLEFLYRSAGPVWYRGMVCADEKYDPLTPEQTDALLRRYDADRLLVGHTIFPDISTFHDGRVIAVNVQNELNRRKNRGRAVLIEGSRISVIGNRGVKRVLEE